MSHSWLLFVPKKFQWHTLPLNCDLLPLDIKTKSPLPKVWIFSPYLVVTPLKEAPGVGRGMSLPWKRGPGRPPALTHQLQHHGEQTVHVSVQGRNSLRNSDCHEEIQINSIKENKRNWTLTMEYRSGSELEQATSQTWDLGETAPISSPEQGRCRSGVPDTESEPQGKRSGIKARKLLNLSMNKSKSRSPHSSLTTTFQG